MHLLIKSPPVVLAQVLCEKPFAANAQEAQEVMELAERHGLVCREAMHWREHAMAERWGWECARLPSRSLFVGAILLSTHRPALWLNFRCISPLPAFPAPRISGPPSFACRQHCASPRAPLSLQSPHCVPPLCSNYRLRELVLGPAAAPEARLPLWAKKPLMPGGEGGVLGQLKSIQVRPFKFD